MLARSADPVHTKKVKPRSVVDSLQSTTVANVYWYNFCCFSDYYYCMLMKHAILILSPYESPLVCYQANCHILGLYIENKVPLGFSWQFQCMYCVNFIKNALFKSSGDICWPPLPSSLLGELSIDERDSDRFISILVVSRSSDSSSLLQALIQKFCMEGGWWGGFP